MRAAVGPDLGGARGDAAPPAGPAGAAVLAARAKTFPRDAIAAARGDTIGVDAALTAGFASPPKAVRKAPMACALDGGPLLDIQ